MLICARHLRALGFATTVFSHFGAELQAWFPEDRFAPRDSSLSSFDSILLQHDNSPVARNIFSLAAPIYAIYGSHSADKHGPIRPGLDYVCSRDVCMAQNMHRACQFFFPSSLSSIENGLAVPKNLVFGRYSKRVAIHTGSASSAKNWRMESFLRLQERLAALGYDAAILPIFPSLSELAAFLYESAYFIGNDSGPGHLASNLGLPTVTIGPCRRHLTLWRPGWAPNRIAAPPPLISSLKLTRTKWSYFITVSQVIKEFTELTEIK